MYTLKWSMNMNVLYVIVRNIFLKLLDVLNASIIYAVIVRSR